MIPLIYSFRTNLLYFHANFLILGFTFLFFNKTLEAPSIIR